MKRRKMYSIVAANETHRQTAAEEILNVIKINREFFKTLAFASRSKSITKVFMDQRERGTITSRLVFRVHCLHKNEKQKQRRKKKQEIKGNE